MLASCKNRGGNQSEKLRTRLYIPHGLYGLHDLIYDFNDFEDYVDFMGLYEDYVDYMRINGIL